MSDDQPPSQPTTTRIGGGGSAHLAAIGVVVVLLGLAWVGWSGRPAVPGAGASPQPGAEASAPPTATDPPLTVGGGLTPGSPGSGGMPYLGEGPDRPRIHLEQDVYGFTATIDGRRYFAVLQETGSDRFTATIRVPFRRPRDTPSVQLHQLWTRAERTNYAYLGSWPLPLEAMDTNVRGTGTVLEVQVGARPQARGQALLVRRGFTLEVGLYSELLFAVLEVDVRLLPRIARRLGEDGRLDPAVDAARLFVDGDRTVR
jgi:hypothetical protein